MPTSLSHSPKGLRALRRTAAGIFGVMERLAGFALPAHTLLLSLCGLAPLDAPITAVTVARAGLGRKGGATSRCERESSDVNSTSSVLYKCASSHVVVYITRLCVYVVMLFLFSLFINSFVHTSSVLARPLLPLRARLSSHEVTCPEEVLRWWTHM